MAFNTNAAAAPSAASSNNANSNWEKAAGFVNLYLPSKDGKRRKLGAIPLKLSKSNEKALVEWLESDEENIGKLATKLIVEYQSAVVSEAHSFDLG